MPSNLDEKLDYILKSSAAVQVNFDKDSLEDYDKLIPAIKAAFADEGYTNFEITHQADCAEVKHPKTDVCDCKPDIERLMTGKEFYDRFEKDLAKQEYHPKRFMLAAARAAGLDKGE